MPVYTGGAPIRAGRLAEEVPTTLGATLEATAEEAWLYSPMDSLRRQGELWRAESADKPKPVNERIDDDFDPLLDEVTEYRAPTSRTLTREEAEARIEQAGLPLKVSGDTISEAALDLLIKRKQAELRRRSVIERGPSGFGTGALKLGTALLVSLADPINVASAFVPVVGPARYAKMLKGAAGTLGRAGVRLRVGAVEGAVGAALVEPLVYSAAQSEQADYDLVDSVLAVGFGTIFGGGLHVGAGALADAFRRGGVAATINAKPDGATASRVAAWPAQDRMVISRAVLAQALEGREIDVAPFVALRDGVATHVPKSPADWRRAAETELIPVLKAQLEKELNAKIKPGELGKLRKEAKSLAAELRYAEAERKARTKRYQKTQRLSRKQAESKVRKEISALRDKVKAVEEKVKAREAITKGAEAKALAELNAGRVPEQYRAQVEQRAREMAGQFRRKPISAAVEKALRGDETVQTSWREVRDAAAQPDTPRADGDQIDLLAKVDELRADETLAEVKAEADEYAELALELAEQMGIADSVKVDMKAADALPAKARELSEAVRAGVICNLRHGA